MLGLRLSEIAEKAKVSAVLNFKDMRVKGLSIDSRTIKKGQGFIAVRGRNFDGHNFLEQAAAKGAAFLVVEKMTPAIKRISLPVLLAKDTVVFLGDTAKLLCSRSAAKVVAVTGSLGKTTTKDMLAHILSRKFKVLKSRGSYNNAIGLPLTLLKINPGCNICVVELGSNHPGEIEYLAGIARPDIGIITSIGLAHTEFFKDLKGVYKEKISLFKNNSAVAVLNADSPLLKNSRIKNKKIYFGLKNKLGLWAEFIKSSHSRSYFRINGRRLLILPTPAGFNIYNALAAMAAAKVLGISVKESSSYLENFSFPKMRFEVKKVKGITFVNDAYNSNPTAMEGFLDSIKNMKVQRKIGVFGDMLELGRKSGYYHLNILRKVLKTGFYCVIITGENFLKVASRLKFGYKCKLVKAGRVEDIPVLLTAYIEKGCWVFLKASRSLGLERVVEEFKKK